MRYVNIFKFMYKFSYDSMLEHFFNTFLIMIDEWIILRICQLLILLILTTYFFDYKVLKYDGKYNQNLVCKKNSLQKIMA